MEAYAGSFFDTDKVKQSASGGAASAIAEAIVKRGGMVYGVTYSSDFYSAEYGIAETLVELDRFKGSKYSYANKYVVKDEKKVTVYCDVAKQLQKGRDILFFGLGCDVAALKMYIQKERVDDDRLYTIELLCDGVTNANVHEDYVKMIEEKYSSKIVDFSLRHKKDGWRPFYLRAKFENGAEHLRMFAASDYGFAFENYKRKECYNCRFKSENHKGDLILADYWGCTPGMKEYNEYGVSLLLVHTDKGKKMIEIIDASGFAIRPVDVDYALNYNPRYFTSHDKYSRWEEFDVVIQEKGLHEAVVSCADIAVPKHFHDCERGHVVVWGTGECFRKMFPFVKDICDVKWAIDSNKNKWGEEVAPGVKCISPDELQKLGNVCVIIMIENVSMVLQVVNKLLDLEIKTFDHVNNWIYYAEKFLDLN